MKHFHVCHNDKFTNPYILFINKNFKKSEHLFLIIGKGMGTHITTGKNVIQPIGTLKALFHLIIQLYRNDRVYLHGLFIPQIIVLLFFQPWLLKKCKWIVWGGDLYSYLNVNKNLKSKIFESMRRFVIKNLGGYITQIKGDYELAKLWYGAKGEYYYSFLYPSNLYKKYEILNTFKDVDKTIIQVGNSADPSNNHIEIFEKLLKYTDKDFEIICPLSYGDLNYAKKIIEKGKQFFGDKFHPLTEFISYNNYIELLTKIDVAIFNHNRQQAIGNIITLMSLEKKIYIREEITTWNFIKLHGLKVYSINKELETVFDPESTNVLKKNRDIIKKEFTEEKLFLDWSKIFSS